METLKASTQYGDCVGTASADRSDAKTLNDLLLKRGLSKEDKFLVRAKLWVGEREKAKFGKNGEVPARAADCQHGS
jgi:hypothetical protein